MRCRVVVLTGIGAVLTGLALAAAILSLPVHVIARKDDTCRGKSNRIKLTQGELDALLAQPHSVKELIARGLLMDYSDVNLCGADLSFLNFERIGRQAGWASAFIAGVLRRLESQRCTQVQARPAACMATR